jgi:hypothetical protein
MMRPIAASAAAVVGAGGGGGVGVAAFLLDQSIRYTCSTEHSYTHDAIQG